MNLSFKQIRFFKKRVPDWSFQREAVSSLVNDFHKDPRGRFLLVIPTGGGKTITAIRSLNKILNKGIITTKDKVLWVVHTHSLKSQTENILKNKKIYKKFKLNKHLYKIINVKMKKGAVKSISSNKKYKIIVIDEAHHSAAQTYQKFFNYPVGILGLTATPRRMDKKNLPFDKISYSITFRNLIKRKVILLPKFLPEIKTNIKINIKSLDNESRLEIFNNEKRNSLIAKNIFRISKKHNLKKIIIFAGTINHAKKLYEVFKKENSINKNFTHIGYIYGSDKNEKKIKNDKYLKWHHSQKSSILINCKVLNEGYDDPKIDTVVMATPTNSILYYMQCIGRVVRNPEEKNSNACVIEITDNLPNVLYRIDNRWLFTEISDYLEPEIYDIKGVWPVKIIKLFRILIAYKTNFKDIPKKELLNIIFGKKINFLLFNDSENPDKNYHWRIFTIKENDDKKIKMFNEISENIEKYHIKNHEYLLTKNYPKIIKEWPLNNRVYKSSLISALQNAFKAKEKKEKVTCLKYLSINK